MPDSENAKLIRSLPWRTRLTILAMMATITLLSWTYLVDMALDMSNMMATAQMPMMVPEPWSLAYFSSMLLMWVIMMVGMMVPTAVPMTLIYAAIGRKAARDGKTIAPTTIFITGYLVIWSLFSVGATLAQWGLDRSGLLSPMMMTNSLLLGGILFITSGVYQLSPFKNACLNHCRSPIDFISLNWKPGSGGAFRMGIIHGGYCLGCCWILMCLLFFGGVMSLFWIGGLTLFVLLEKVLSFGILGGRLAGVAIIFIGIVFLARSFIY
jgi:predicted metal-binding membrane protein